MTAKQKSNLLLIISFIGAIVLVGGIVYGAGGNEREQNVMMKSNCGRIDKLEAHHEEVIELLDDIKEIVEK